MTSKRRPSFLLKLIKVVINDSTALKLIFFCKYHSSGIISAHEGLFVISNYKSHIIQLIGGDGRIVSFAFA